MNTTKNKTSTKNSNGANVHSGGNPPPMFVKYRLTEAELSQARNACVGLADIGGIITQFIDEGYKFSAGVDNYGGGMQAFITPNAKCPDNQGWTLSARAPDLLLAVGMLAFKHYTLFGQNWPKDVPERKGETWG
jgi:hypothetical protein